MTRVVEAHPKVLVMRNPKTESKEKFMARAEELANRLYEEPVEAETVEESVEETIQTIRSVKTELDYLRWWHNNFGTDDTDVRATMNARYVEAGGIIPEGYQNE